MLDYHVQSTFNLLKDRSFLSNDLIHFHNLHSHDGYFNIFALALIAHKKPCVWTLHDMQAITGHCAHSFECEKWQSGCQECPDLSIYPALRKDSAGILWRDKKNIYELIDVDIVTPSHWLKSKVEKSILADKRIRVIPNGIDLNVFKQHNKRQSRELLKLPQDKTILAFAADGGLNNRWKGGGYLHEALKYLSHKHPEVLLLNIGGSIDCREYHVVNIPYIKDKNTLAVVYSVCDIFAYPSVAETFGLVVLEALACGLPVVTFDTGGIPEIVEHGKSGIVTRYKDISEFIKGLELLINDQELRNQLSCNAVRNIKHEHSLEGMSHSYLDLYFELIQESKSLTRNDKVGSTRLSEHQLKQRYADFGKKLSGIGNKVGAEAFLREAEEEKSSRVVPASSYNNGGFSDKGSSDNLSDLMKAVQEHPDSVAAHNNIGRLYLQRGQIAEALRHFTKALKINPYDRTTVLNCGQILAGYGRFEDAKKLYRSYLRQNPADDEIIRILKNLDSDEAVGSHDKSALAGSDDMGLERKQAEEKGYRYLVSAIVSTYNAERFIRGSLEDLVNQTLFEKGKLEIVVVNSGSEQNEESVVQEYLQKYDHIKYIKTEERETVYKAWNRGIRAACGKYITNANTDDRRRKDAMEVIAGVLEERPEIAVVYADQIVSHRENETFENNTSTDCYKYPDYTDTLFLEMGWCCIGSQPMWRAQLHNELGFFDEEFVVAGDCDFFLRVSERYKFFHLPQILGTFYRAADTISCNFKNRFRLTQIENPLAMARSLLRRGIQCIQEGEFTTAIQYLRRSLLDCVSREAMQNLQIALKKIGYDDSCENGERELNRLASVYDWPDVGSPCRNKNCETNRRFDTTIINGKVVSVIVSTYGSEGSIRECLEDLENQTIADKSEIIVVGKGPEAAEQAIIREFQDRYGNIRCVPAAGQTTVYAGLNRVIKAAIGKYITIVNRGDRHREDAFEIMVGALEEHPEKALAYVVADKTNGSGDKRVSHLKNDPGEFLRDCLIIENFIGPQVLWHRMVHGELGYFDEGFVAAGEYEFLLRMAQDYEFISVSAVPETCLCGPRDRTQSELNFETAIIQKCYQYAKLFSTRIDEKGISGNTAFSDWSELNLWKKRREDKIASKESDTVKKVYDFRLGHKTPLLSIVIVTYNNGADLLENLNALNEQTEESFEVIVVNNGESIPELTVRNKVWQFEWCYIELERNYGPSLGRNNAAKHAQAKYIAFLDDDAVAERNFVKNIVNHFWNNDICGLTGKVLPKTGDFKPEFYDLGDEVFCAYANMEGNSAFRKDIFFKVNGFDEYLYGGEGLDLSYRIYKSENERLECILYFPDVVIYHNPYKSSKATIEKLIRYKRTLNLVEQKDQRITNYKQSIDRLNPRNFKKHKNNYTHRLNDPAAPLNYVDSVPKSRPEVSIVTSCYNCEKFLAETIDSIRNQTMQEWELFLLDDASTDGTKNVIEKYSQMDRRIKPYYFETNQGPYVRRNFGIERARSDFIVIHDADDIMCPNKLEALYKEVTKDPQLAIVGSFYREFLNEFKGLQYTEAREFPTEQKQIIDGLLSAMVTISHASSIIRKDLFEAIGLYDENRCGCDSFWLTKVAIYAHCDNNIKLKNIPEFLMLRRMHSSSQTGLIPIFDPRSRRFLYGEYYRGKLNKITAKVGSLPWVNIKAELKSCNCSDFIERYGHIIQQEESKPLDNNSLVRLANGAVQLFNSHRYATCISGLNGLEKMGFDIVKRFRNYDLLRAIAYFALDMKGLCLEHLNREIQNHNNPAARQFISDYFENQSTSDVQSWCLKNGKLCDLRIIDTDSEGTNERKNEAFLDIHSFAPQGEQKHSFQDFSCERSPLVSVIMPAYNAQEYIKEAIDSVFGQSYKNFELIIVDDGSTDKTKDIITGFASDKIKYSYKENEGAASARNAGIKNSKGKFIINLGPSDMMMPDFITKHLQEFEKHPEADLVYCNDHLIDANGKLIRVIERPEYTGQKPLIRDLFRCGYSIVPFGTCIRRGVYDKIGFYDEALLAAEDYDMMRRFVRGGLKMYHFRDALYLRRKVSDSFSADYTAEKARCHFEVVRRFIDTFSYDELFPDVEWDKIAPQGRQLHAKCLAAVTCLAIGQAYVRSNASIYAQTAFEQARLELNDCIKIDPNNQQVRRLLQRCEFARAGTAKHAVCRQYKGPECDKVPLGA